MWRHEDTLAIATGLYRSDPQIIDSETYNLTKIIYSHYAVSKGTDAYKETLEFEIFVLISEIRKIMTRNIRPFLIGVLMLACSNQKRLVAQGEDGSRLLRCKKILNI
jgi:hypothetical protein